jgi:hypothetical protein
MFGMMGDEDARLARAVEAKDAIESFLTQGSAIPAAQTVRELSTLGYFLRTSGAKP